MRYLINLGIAAAVSYLFFSFVAWSFSLAHWDKFDRFGVVVLCILVAFFMTMEESNATVSRGPR